MGRPANARASFIAKRGWAPRDRPKPPPHTPDGLDGCYEFIMTSINIGAPVEPQGNIDTTRCVETLETHSTTPLLATECSHLPLSVSGGLRCGEEFHPVDGGNNLLGLGSFACLRPTSWGLPYG